MRRFVQENQGLMRRMYGIERQIDILKAEFDKKDIELDYDDEQYIDGPRFGDYKFLHFINLILLRLNLCLNVV